MVVIYSCPPFPAADQHQCTPPSQPIHPQLHLLQVAFVAVAGVCSSGGRPCPGAAACAPSRQHLRTSSVGPCIAVSRACCHCSMAPAPGDKYSIIVPTYNECENIPILLWMLHDTCSGAGIDYEVVVVDDNSPDGTQDAVRQVQAILGKHRVLLQPRRAKLGLGSAYKHGLDHASGNWVFLMDADFSHHPKYIPSMIQQQRATSADIVASTRYRAGGGVAGWDLKRKLTSRGANVLASTLLGVAASDLTGAYRLYRRRALDLLLPQVRAWSCSTSPWLKCSSSMMCCGALCSCA